MANDFKLHATTLDVTTNTTLVTATGSSVFLVGSIIIANTTAATDTTVSLTVLDSSQSTEFNILTLEPINRGVSREILSRPLILENGDSLKIQATTADVFDVLVSYLDKNRD